jgi:quercetin dioxygenase-like cupin family protein
MPVRTGGRKGGGEDGSYARRLKQAFDRTRGLILTREEDKMNRNKRIRMAIVPLLVLAVFTGTVGAQDSPISVTNFVRATIAPNEDGKIKARADGIRFRAKRSTDVLVQTLTLAPGASSGWHLHPAIVVVAVQSGTLTEYDAKCRAQVFSANQAFVESAGDVHLVKNTGTTDVVLYATYLFQTEVPDTGLLVPVSRPRGCPVS